MSSRASGKNITAVEVTHISMHGIWFLTGEKELFLSFDDFPWFKNASVEKILMSKSFTLDISTGRIWMLTFRKRL